MNYIARIYTDFSSKFGIPRQSRMVKELQGKIVFEPEFRNPEAVRGLEDFSHIWLIWEFSEAKQTEWSPTVRPPILGGNIRKGVFATRSPFRPNSLGLSAVKLDKVEIDNELGSILYVSGADLMNGTPIFDIKPYIPYADSIPDAKGGFTEEVEKKVLKVVFPDELLKNIPQEKQNPLVQMLALDPRPAYQDDDGRIYGLEFAGFDVRFLVDDDVLTVVDMVDM
ncbi:MAG TPA: tRNA (N6-threonylcarbamoyladenosine(37)-N6)-methyltransferase TrmO [Bacteroidales bacterium]|nr:tRNA (N6-threonylcarbamoyladenosine(37)-N6)-methyltransferase TrmO [Bacteroidales bacterium]